MKPDTGGYSNYITTSVVSTGSIFTAARWKFCPDCGKGLDADWNHCAGCGKLIRSSAPALPYLPPAGAAGGWEYKPPQRCAYEGLPPGMYHLWCGCPKCSPSYTAESK